MPRLRPAKPQEVQRVLETLGFQLIRQSGCHVVYSHPDGRWTTVPLHPGIDIGDGVIVRWDEQQ